MRARAFEAVIVRSQPGQDRSGRRLECESLMIAWRRGKLDCLAAAGPSDGCWPGLGEEHPGSAGDWRGKRSEPQSLRQPRRLRFETEAVAGPDQAGRADDITALSAEAASRPVVGSEEMSLHFGRRGFTAAPSAEPFGDVG